jgi:hypothetical protein
VSSWRRRHRLQTRGGDGPPSSPSAWARACDRASPASSAAFRSQLGAVLGGGAVRVLAVTLELTEAHTWEEETANELGLQISG